MTDQQNPDRPQTLLEAAKAATSSHDSYTACSVALRDLRSAIAREEVKQASLQDDAGRYAYWKSKATRYESERDTCYSDYQKEAARAQQAEASAAWHKAESERLSQALAEAKKSVAYLANRACDTIPVDTSGHWQQRAEDAEAKVRNLQRQNRDAVDERDRLRFHTETIEYRLHCVRQALGVAP